MKNAMSIEGRWIIYKYKDKKSLKNRNYFEKVDLGHNFVNMILVASMKEMFEIEGEIMVGNGRQYQEVFIYNLAGNLTYSRPATHISTTPIYGEWIPNVNTLRGYLIQHEAVFDRNQAQFTWKEIAFKSAGVIRGYTDQVYLIKGAEIWVVTYYLYVGTNDRSYYYEEQP